jgi:transposase InsO family protein
VVRSFAQQYPWWGYKRLAVVLRRAGEAVTNRFVYRVLKAAGLLLRRRRRDVELYQAARLFELLPQGPNELWQADVTYLHIPGHGWWYAVTVIDYYSRYLLGLHLSPSFDAAALIVGIEKAKAEAERLHGLSWLADQVDPVAVTRRGSSQRATRAPPTRSQSPSSRSAKFASTAGPRIAAKLGAQWCLKPRNQPRRGSTCQESISCLPCTSTVSELRGRAPARR